MIARIKGKIVEREQSQILLDVGGLCYQVLIPQTDMQRLDEFFQEDGTISLITYHYHHVEPSRQTPVLIGFLNEIEKEFFETFGVAPDVLEKSDIHIHVPAGATPKDGPSAGVALFVALASLLTGRPVRSDVAMTGEISLRGLVLPIGGVKEKVLAALRAGIKTVLLPARNKRDLDEMPADVREQLTFVWVEQLDEAMVAALAPATNVMP